ncbi:MAG: hypothetical protein VR65_24875 [Desulfobulbaceae bacterium BRH_c16a]|nr:MAG: hypothetical protein VR65_24875 [Desulfobulbaceae bacterium BRH_c16a]
MTDSATARPDEHSGESNNKEFSRVEFTIPPEGADFQKTIAMLDWWDFCEEEDVQLLSIDIMAQNSTGGYSLMCRADVHDYVIRQVASRKGHVFETFKVVVRGQRVQSGAEDPRP